jgi:hypothetical protein
MSADAYLRGLLAKYFVPTHPTAPLRIVAAEVIFPSLQSWAGRFLNDMRFSGSFAKGTANNCSNDLDVFISLEPSAPDLKKIYESLFQHAQEQGWNPRAQDVSVGANIRGFKVDLVPGRLQHGFQNWHSIFRRRSGSWTQTNIQNHIDLVTSSGRIEEIRLTKLWRHLAGVNFPSFILELAVIQALSGHRRGNLSENFWDALGWLRDNIQTVRLVDPSNTNNVISDDLTLAEKRAIADAARAAREKTSYSDFVW